MWAGNKALALRGKGKLRKWCPWSLSTLMSHVCLAKWKGLKKKIKETGLPLCLTSMLLLFFREGWGGLRKRRVCGLGQCKEHSNHCWDCEGFSCFYHMWEKAQPCGYVLRRTEKLLSVSDTGLWLQIPVRFYNDLSFGLLSAIKILIQCMISGRNTRLQVNLPQSQAVAACSSAWLLISVLSFSWRWATSI